MEINARLVLELRSLAASGAEASELLAVIRDRLGLADENFRLIAIAYFREAFYLSLADASMVGAANIFPDGGRTAKQVDTQMHSIIERTRSVWMVR